MGRAPKRRGRPLIDRTGVRGDASDVVDPRDAIINPLRAGPIRSAVPTPVLFVLARIVVLAARTGAWVDHDRRLANIVVGPHHRRSSTTVSSMSDTVQDRKSTRLNSSHLGISYAVF